MANLAKGATWNGTVEQTHTSNTYTFDTANKYTDRNIELEVDVPGMNLNPNETFYVNDGIYNWTWQIDANGNVTIF